MACQKEIIASGDFNIVTNKNRPCILEGFKASGVATGVGHCKCCMLYVEYPSRSAVLNENVIQLDTD